MNLQSIPAKLDQRANPGKAQAPLPRWAVLGYFAAALVLGWISGPEWHPLAGLRLAALWLLPVRSWGVLALFEALAAVALGASLEVREAPFTALTALIEWSAMAAVVRLMPWFDRGSGIVSVSAMGRAQAVAMSAAVSAALATALVAQWRVGVRDGLLHLEFHAVVARYVGMLMLVPALLHLFERPFPGRLWRLIGRRLALWAVFLVPLAVAVWFLLPPLRQFMFLLALPAWCNLLFAYGWRGGTPILVVLGAVPELMRWLHMPHTSGDLAAFAALGTLALLLGATVESLRLANSALRETVARERRINAALADRTVLMRELGRRMIQAREDEQARITRELHDELGQIVTALGTRLGLLEARSQDAMLREEMAGARAMVRQLREAIRAVAGRLRPPMLDRFGLAAALRDGPIADMLRDAGVGYDLEISGQTELLDGDSATAIYRICQEAATNCARHAQAHRFHLRLVVGKRHDGRLSVRLTASDDGKGIRPEGASRDGHGLGGIADRVLALSGDYGIASTHQGTRHEVTLVVAPKPDTE